MFVERQAELTVAVTGRAGEPVVRAEAVPAAEVLIGLAALDRSAGPADPGWASETAPAVPAAAVPPVPAEADLPVRLRAALRRVGPDPAEVWLHLLGVAIEAPPPRDGAALLAAVEAMPADELLRHVLGYHVPAWRAYVDGEVIAAAAGGDRAAQRVLLAHPRYYAGAARATLRGLLRGGAERAAELLRVAIARWYADVAGPREEAVRAVLERAATRARAVLAAAPAPDAIERVTAGYRHTPEPGIDRVLLLPHLAMRPYLLLCQHRIDRVCGYPVLDEDLTGAPAQDVTAELLRVLGALDDEQRLRMVAALAAGPQTLQSLADRLGLAKSTVHHHLVRLRAGGLVSVHRNPDRSYSYGLRRAALAAIPALLDQLAGGAGG